MQISDILGLIGTATYAITTFSMVVNQNGDIAQDERNLINKAFGLHKSSQFKTQMFKKLARKLVKVKSQKKLEKMLYNHHYLWNLTDEKKCKLIFKKTLGLRKVSEVKCFYQIVKAVLTDKIDALDKSIKDRFKTKYKIDLENITDYNKAEILIKETSLFCNFSKDSSTKVLEEALVALHMVFVDLMKMENSENGNQMFKKVKDFFGIILNSNS
ncbi:hypothetical protein NUSPORA_01108 [Nucleospora cyclopteri]